MTSSDHDALLPSARVALAAGAYMPPERFGPITRTDLVRYAGAGGDFNPLHHDELQAVAAGLPSVFAMGMFPAGLLGLRLARWVGPENIRTFSVRFTGQVWPGDELTLLGSVDEILDEGGDSLAAISLSVEREGGETVLTARATASVARSTAGAAV